MCVWYITYDIIYIYICIIISQLWRCTGPPTEEPGALPSRCSTAVPVGGWHVWSFFVYESCKSYRGNRYMIWIDLINPQKMRVPLKWILKRPIMFFGGGSQSWPRQEFGSSWGQIHLRISGGPWWCQWPRPATFSRESSAWDWKGEWELLKHIVSF